MKSHSSICVHRTRNIHNGKTRSTRCAWFSARVYSNPVYSGHQFLPLGKKLGTPAWVAVAQEDGYIRLFFSPPSLCGAHLDLYRWGISATPFPRRLCVLRVEILFTRKKRRSPLLNIAHKEAQSTGIRTLDQYKCIWQVSEVTPMNNKGDGRGAYRYLCMWRRLHFKCGMNLRDNPIESSQ